MGGVECPSGRSGLDFIYYLRDVTRFNLVILFAPPLGVM